MCHFLIFFTSSLSTRLTTGSYLLCILTHKCGGVSLRCWYHFLWIQTFRSRRAWGAATQFSEVGTVAFPPVIDEPHSPRCVSFELWLITVLTGSVVSQGFDTHTSLVAKEGNPSFSGLLVIWISSFKKNLFILPARFLIGLLGFQYWVKSFFHIWNINSVRWVVQNIPLSVKRLR